MLYNRRKFKDLRKGITHRVTIGEVKIFITVNLFENGIPGEIFIKAGCVNSIKNNQDEYGLQGWCHSLAILISLCLQAGVPISLIAKHLQFQSFKPNGFANTDNHYASSIVDYLSRWVMREFKGKEK